MAVHLTETAIAKAVREAAESGARTDLADAGCRGLRLRVTPSGVTSWVLACRDREGRMRRFPLGSYPAVGVGKARKDAQALHVKVKHDGADPVADRRRQRAMGEAAKAGEGTLAATLTIYTEKRGGKQKAWAEARKRIELVFKSLLNRPMAALTAGDFQILADAYKAQASASYAVRHLRPVLKWAAQRGYTSAATAVIHPPAIVQRRQRVLSRDELAALLPVLAASDRPSAASCASCF
jgi:hypothetical protein